MKRILYSIILILLFLSNADAQEMRAFVDKTDIALGDSVQFTVSVSGGDGKVDAPVEECDPPSVGACDAFCLRDLAKQIFTKSFQEHREPLV